MNFWHWMAGEAQISLTCADREAALKTMILSGIDVWEVRDVDALTVQFRILAGKLRQLSLLAQRKGWQMAVVEKVGFWRTVGQCLSRPLLLLGVILILGASVYLPSRVLFVRVEGNPTVPTRKILDQASRCGIGFGASRQAVRSQKMKDALLDAMPELQWAGVNTAGCVATITVRERAEDPEPEKHIVSSIVAARDGVLTDVTVTQGTARFAVGQAVRAGEVLISGYTDCGFCIRAQRAKGEVFARTERDLEAVVPSEWQLERDIQPSEKKYALILGKKRINFYKGSGNSGTVCDKIYEEYYITLPGGFQLPVCIVTEIWYTGELTETVLSEDVAQSMLTACSDRYLSESMTAGTVTKQHCELAAGEGIYSLSGHYACIEMIGRQRNEENLIGKYN